MKKSTQDVKLVHHKLGTQMTHEQKQLKQAHLNTHFELENFKEALATFELLEQAFAAMPQQRIALVASFATGVRISWGIPSIKKGERILCSTHGLR